MGKIGEIRKLAIDFLPDFFDLVAEGEIEFEILLDAADAVHNGGVIFDADFGSDFVGAEAKLLGKEIHGDLAGVFDMGNAGFAAHFLDREVIILGDLLDNLFGRNGARLGAFANGNGAVLDELPRCETADFGHEEDGGEFALEVANVGVDVLGDVFDGFGFDFSAEEFGFGAENSAFVLEFGELKVEGASPGEARSEALVDGFDLTREAIASDDNLLVELIEVVEDIEELFLGFFFADDELEIVDDEDV